MSYKQLWLLDTRSSVVTMGLGCGEELTAHQCLWALSRGKQTSWQQHKTNQSFTGLPYFLTVSNPCPPGYFLYVLHHLCLQPAWHLSVYFGLNSLLANGTVANLWWVMAFPHMAQIQIQEWFPKRVLLFGLLFKPPQKSVVCWGIPWHLPCLSVPSLTSGADSTLILCCPSTPMHPLYVWAGLLWGLHA